MIYYDLIKNNLLKPEEIGFDQIKRLTQRAVKDLKSARLLLKSDEDGAFKFAYEAMLHAGRALVFSQGFRPRVKDSHKTVVECVKRTLSDEFEFLVDKFDRMRVNRHELFYDAGFSISETAASNAIKNAAQLVRKIIEKIQKNNPQQKLL